jgi:hypothetical protein
MLRALLCWKEVTITIVNLCCMKRIMEAVGVQTKCQIAKGRVRRGAEWISQITVALKLFGRSTKILFAENTCILNQAYS